MENKAGGGEVSIGLVGLLRRLVTSAATSPSPDPTTAVSLHSLSSHRSQNYVMYSTVCGTRGLHEFTFNKTVINIEILLLRLWGQREDEPTNPFV